jgi:hypothetical protein
MIMGEIIDEPAINLEDTDEMTIGNTMGGGAIHAGTSYLMTPLPLM